MSLEALDRGLPITLVTGFLGSGKTTLVNHILTNNKGFKTAVIVNEFGDIGIDSALIVTTDESMIELDNGCVCCTVREDLIDAVLQIMERPNPVDHLIIETTGLADPGPVAMTFMSPQLRPLTRLDAIVGVVDAEHFAPDLFSSQTAISQIEYSDIVLLNKVDCVTSERLEQLKKQIKEIRPDALIIPTTNSEVDLRLILDVGAFNMDRYFAQQPAEPEVHDHDHHDHDHHHHHFETEGFSSVSVELEEPLSVQKLEHFLKTLPEGVFRAKGFIWLKENPEKVILHMVGSRLRLDYERWKTPPKNQVVFIGQNIDKEAIRQGFLACVSIKTKPKARGFLR